MTFSPVDNHRSEPSRQARAVLWGTVVTLIIALIWSLCEAWLLPLRVGAAEPSGVLGWGVAVFGGCRMAQIKAGKPRFPYAAERVALHALLFALLGEGITWLHSGSPAITWNFVVLRILVGFLALYLAVKLGPRERRVRGYETYAQRNHHFGKALLEERE